MASEMVNAVLKAEAAAKNAEKAASIKAEKIIEEAEKKAKYFEIAAVEQAQSEAKLILTEADYTVNGIIKQAESLAVLREKKVISDTEKKYVEAIQLVLDNLV